ncbi:MAG TPA: metal-sulfur cluster assembly factor [Actinomycetota bacterium]|jgi:metal-sulfur cluster biosynthetic enzyme|nr:metal-sulfur cluster assembly factor [Actinomycetota bacterium]
MEETDSDFASGVTTLPGEGGTEDVRREVVEALTHVVDPELGINIVDLGLVYDLSIEDGTARVTYTLTTMGCPIGPLIESQMSQLVDRVEGIDGFEAEMVFSPAWTPEKMSEEAKAALGMF